MPVHLSADADWSQLSDEMSQSHLTRCRPSAETTGRRQKIFWAFTLTTADGDMKRSVSSMSLVRFIIVYVVMFWLKIFFIWITCTIRAGFIFHDFNWIYNERSLELWKSKRWAVLLLLIKMINHRFIMAYTNEMSHDLPFSVTLLLFVYLFIFILKDGAEHAELM